MCVGVCPRVNPLLLPNVTAILDGGGNTDTSENVGKNMERLEVCRSDVMLLLFSSFFFNLFFTSSDFFATVSCRYTSVC